MSPLVSAVILNFGSGRKAAECAKHLRAQMPESELEVLVVDNHSQDDSIGIIRNCLKHTTGMRIVETPKNAGFGRGYGAAFSHTEGKYILINNPEKKLQPGALALMLAKMESDPSIGIVGPKILHDDGTVRLSVRAFPHPTDVLIKRTFLQKIFQKNLRRYLQLDASVDEERDVDWVIGGCLLVRKDLMEQLGGFDPRYFLFFEDIDLCRSCWKTGKRVVYLPTAVAVDRKRRLSEGGVFSLISSKVGRAHIASAVRYFAKWGTGIARPTI